ncbi:hypothetical protein ACR0S4_28610 [Priestia megaterium]|uniref:hypothetical protein n=1 Tax=Priestia megaterium TaxID=1404 RepID=UPI003D982549
MKKLWILLCLSFFFILCGCEDNNSKQVLGGEGVINLNSRNSDSIHISKEMNELKTASEVAESDVPFTQFKGFVPNKKNSDYITIKGEDILYVKPVDEPQIISGSLIYENNTKNPMEIQSLFLQGNEVAKIKLSSESSYHNALKYKVSPFSSVTIEVDIKVKKHGESELTFFPFDLTASNDFYNGANNAISRFYLDVNEQGKGSHSFKSHSFSLKQEEMENIENIFPLPYWVDSNKQDIKEVFKDNKVYMKKRISGLKLMAIPYETKVDVLLVDEFGNISIIAENKGISKNKGTYIPIENHTIKEIYNSKQRQFLLILNNRGEEMITDLNAVNQDMKPFPTTYNSIIEFHKSLDSKQ